MPASGGDLEQLGVSKPSSAGTTTKNHVSPAKEKAAALFKPGTAKPPAGNFPCSCSPPPAELKFTITCGQCSFVWTQKASSSSKKGTAICPICDHEQLVVPPEEQVNGTAPVKKNGQQGHQPSLTTSHPKVINSVHTTNAAVNTDEKGALLPF